MTDTAWCPSSWSRRPRPLQGLCLRTPGQPSSSRLGGLDWPEATEDHPAGPSVPPAMRTLQRFQSSHRSRGVAGGGPGGIPEPVTRAPLCAASALATRGTCRTCAGWTAMAATAPCRGSVAGELGRVCGWLLPFTPSPSSDQPNPSLCSCRFGDIDLPSAVKYLMASDPNLAGAGSCLHSAQVLLTQKPPRSR